MKCRSWPFQAVLLPTIFLVLGCTSDRAKISGICTRPMPADVTQAHVAAALDQALAPGFIQYALDLRKPMFYDGPRSGSDVRAGIQVELLPYSELTRRGVSIQPAPRADQTYVHYAFEGHDADALFAQELMSDYLEDLIALELLRTADSEKARLAALDLLTPTVPHGAEWIARELERFLETKPAAPVEEAARKKLEYVRGYIADPTLRALPAGFRVELK